MPPLLGLAMDRMTGAYWRLWAARACYALGGSAGLGAVIRLVA